MPAQDAGNRSDRRADSSENDTTASTQAKHAESCGSGLCCGSNSTSSRCRNCPGPRTFEALRAASQDPLKGPMISEETCRHLLGKDPGACTVVQRATTQDLFLSVQKKGSSLKCQRCAIPYAPFCALSISVSECSDYCLGCDLDCRRQDMSDASPLVGVLLIPNTSAKRFWWLVSTGYGAVLIQQLCNHFGEGLALHSICQSEMLQVGNIPSNTTFASCQNLPAFVTL